MNTTGLIWMRRACVALVFLQAPGSLAFAQVAPGAATDTATAAPTQPVAAPSTPPAGQPATSLVAETPPAAPAQSAAAPSTQAAAPSSTQQPGVTPEDGVVVTKTTTVSTVTAPGAVAVHTDLPSDLSIQGMFNGATIVVKAVMGVLLMASVLTWGIWLYKAVELGVIRRRALRQLRAIAEATSLTSLSGAFSKGPIAQLVKIAELEIAASEHLPSEGVKERVAIALQRIESSAARRVSVGTGVLASVASTGPFVGLFGTVWGIMNSFIHISNSHTTNLSVVAPGIAEALLATAMGLVAAIPATVIYNMFSRSIAGYKAILGDASAALMRHVSRDLDRVYVNDYLRRAAE